MHVPISFAQWINTAVPAYPSVTGLRQPISARSLGRFVYAVVWGWLLLVGFTGWGRCAGRIFRVERLPTAVSCSLGIAVVILLGGILNLLHAITVPTIFLIVAIGLVLYFLLREERPDNYRWRESWTQAPRMARVLLIVTLAIVALRASATIRLSSFDATDDGSSYLAFPQVMLAYHHFSPGPFSDRHIISSVGGGYWLQACIIAATSLANIAMADRALGLLLLFAAVWDLGIAFGLLVEQIAIIEFLVYLVPQPTANLTFVILPICLLLALLWFILRSDTDAVTSIRKYAFLAGVIGGATVALKSTFLPCVGSFCLVPYLLMYRRRSKYAIGLPIIAGVGAIVVLVAWMLAMRHTAGTYLFPVLGHGLDHTNTGVFGLFKIAKTPRTIVKLFLQGLALVVLSLVAFSLSLRKRHALFCFSVMIAAALGITAFNLAAGGDSIWRYGFPQFFSAILIYSIGLFALSRDAIDIHRKYTALALAIFPLAGCIFYYDIAGARPQPFRQITWESSHYGPGLRASLSGRSLSNPTLVFEYRALQAALPGSDIALENIAYPFLLDYKAHKTYLMDWPGAAGPAPGWPFGKNSFALAQYLQQNSVRYVLYDDRYADWADARSCQVLANPQRYSSELYVLFWMSLLAHQQLDALQSRYRAVFDDGKLTAIDLAQPIENAPAERRVWTVNTDKREMCSTVMARYMANPLQPGSE